MALPIIQPQTINYAQWDWNPGTTFLAAARTTASMLDNIKQAEQMDRKLALEEKVKTTLLPFEVMDAQAKIDYTKAQTALAASRSRALADGAQTLSILESMDGMPTEQLYDIAGLPVESSAPSSSAPAATKKFNPATPSPTGGSFDSINLPADNPLQPFYSQNEAGALESIAAQLPDGSMMSELTNPKFGLASSKDGISTDAAPRAEEMAVLEARANEPKVTNPLDWDENPAVTETPAPAKAGSLALDADAEAELKGIRSQLGTNPLETMPESPEAERPEGPSIGAYISKRWSDLQTAAQNAKNAKGNDRKVINAAAVALERRLYEDVAAKYDIDDPVVVQKLVRGPGGLRRTADEIESIYGAMRDRSVELPDGAGGTKRLQVTNWVDAFEAAEEKRNSIKSQLKAKVEGGLTQEDLTKSLSNLNTAQEAYAKAQSTGDPRQISAAKIGLELAEDNTNQVSGGRLYQERHQSNQNSILQAIGNQGNPKINWGGVAYDDPSLKNSQDPTAKLSAEQYLASQVTNGAIPTVTFTKNANGEVIANADAASNYLNKVGAKQTLVASWDGPELKWFNFTPSAEQGKQLVPFTKKAPPPASDAKKSSEAASPNESGKRLGGAVKPALQKTANFLKGPNADELLNRADYVATGIRNNITAPAVEWAAGVAGEDLDMGRTPNPSVADRDKKQLTAKERAAILSRTQNPLTNLFLNK